MHLRDGLQTHVTVRQRYDHLVELAVSVATLPSSRLSPPSTG